MLILFRIVPQTLTVCNIRRRQTMAGMAQKAPVVNGLSRGRVFRGGLMVDPSPVPTIDYLKGRLAAM